MTIFHKAKSDFELLDMLRVRYQMFAEDIQSLNGILLGYSLARPDGYESNIQDFSANLSKMNGVNPHAVSWMEQISNEARHPEYEIPVLFTHLDQYRSVKYDELGEVELTWEQRDFDFRRRLEKINVDYMELPLKQPHVLKAIRIPGAKVHAFFFDENNFKYYEQCLGDMERLEKWATDCFNIGPTQW